VIWTADDAKVIRLSGLCCADLAKGSERLTVARGLLSDGFKESATAMLFVKELAVRIEEPALAPVVVR